MLGGRDVALGLGVVIALDRGAPVRGWLEAGALADGLDFTSTVLARDEIPPVTFAVTAATSAAATLVGIWLSRQLDPAPSADPGHPEAVATGHPPERAGADSG
jgi:peptide-methionine (R)-S-oxide reductase